jgi:hypothetical protein
MHTTQLSTCTCENIQTEQLARTLKLSRIWEKDKGNEPDAWLSTSLGGATDDEDVPKRIYDGAIRPLTGCVI